MHKAFINIYLFLITLTYFDTEISSSRNVCMLKFKPNECNPLLHVGLKIKRLKPHRIQQTDILLKTCI